MAQTAGVLAALAAAAYTSDPARSAVGFAPLAAAGLTNGTYANQNAFGAALTGTLAGQKVVVLAFRGSDDKQDWLNDLANINQDYAKLAPLVSAVDAYAAQNQAAVIVTGHSLGGALAQVFMAGHPAGGAVPYFGVTFGSPGALLADRYDGRIVNYQIADDPITYFGEYRVEIGDKARADSLYADTVAATFAAVVGRGLTAPEVKATIPFLTADYANSGATIELPSAAGSLALLPLADFLTPLSFSTTLVGRGSEHDPQLYVARASSSSVPDPTFQVTPGEHLNPAYRFFDRSTGDHFYTSAALEKSFIEANLSFMTYEHVAWATPDKGPNTIDVFRFLNTSSGDHFFTSSVVERDTILQTLPAFQYEGLGFEAYAANTGDPGQVTLERFFNRVTGDHHFAANAQEVASIRAGLAGQGWVDEGPAFTVHVPTPEMLLL